MKKKEEVATCLVTIRRQEDSDVMVFSQIDSKMIQSKSHHKHKGVIFDEEREKERYGDHEITKKHTFTGFMTEMLTTTED